MPKSAYTIKTKVKVWDAIERAHDDGLSYTNMTDRAIHDLLVEVPQLTSSEAQALVQRYQYRGFE